MTDADYVAQRGRDDCGVAAMAMFMGCSYEQAMQRIKKVVPDYVEGSATGLTVLMAVLGTYEEFPVATFLRSYAAPALLCVTSPADPNLGHAVYWDGARIWDPAPTHQVTEDWLEARCYLQIQRVRDLTDIMGSRAAGAIQAALGDPNGDILGPGERSAA